MRRAAPTPARQQLTADGVVVSAWKKSLSNTGGRSRARRGVGGGKVGGEGGRRVEEREERLGGRGRKVRKGRGKEMVRKRGGRGSGGKISLGMGRKKGRE